MINDRSDTHGYPGSEWRPSVFASPLSQSLALLSSPEAVEMQWWQSYANPAYNKNLRVGTGIEAYLRDLQTNGPYRVIIKDTQAAMKRWFEEGSYTTGDIAVMFDETQCALSIYDWIIPYGARTSPAGIIDAATFQYKETVIRGSTSLSQSGTISSIGTAVVGVGTSFLSLHPGDIIAVGSGSYIIASISDNTHLILVSAPIHNWTGIAYNVLSDRTVKSPIANIVQIRDAGTIYPSSQYAISSDLGGIEWLNPMEQPAQGSQYSLSYRYYPTYQVTEYGRKGRVVEGRPELSVVMCKLLNPDTQTR